jgi:hypothetical protein
LRRLERFIAGGYAFPFGVKSTAAWPRRVSGADTYAALRDAYEIAETFSSNQAAMFRVVCATFALYS